MDNNSNDAAALRRNFIKLCAAAGMAATGIPGLAMDKTAPVKTGPAKRMMIIDGLGDITNENLSEAEQSGPNQGIDLRALDDARTSGLCAFNHTLGYVFGDQEPFEYSVSEIGIWDALIRRHANRLTKIGSVADIHAAQQQGKIGVIYGFQNAAMMGNDARRVEIFANLGVKVIQLTYNIRNQLGDGSMVGENNGLTEFGRAVVHELNRNRVLVDLSHSGENTCLDAIGASTKPVIISHTGCRAVTDLPRNKTDKELKQVADQGGYVGIYFMPFLAAGRQPMASDLIAHIEHAIQICGEDHVGIGTDGSVPKIDDMPAYMNNLKKEIEQRRAQGIGAAGERADIVKFLPDLVGTNKFYRLAELLEQRGHTSTRVEKILGLNFLRVAGQVW